MDSERLPHVLRKATVPVSCWEQVRVALETLTSRVCRKVAAAPFPSSQSYESFER